MAGRLGGEKGVLDDLRRSKQAAVPNAGLITDALANWLPQLAELATWRTASSLQITINCDPTGLGQTLATTGWTSYRRASGPHTPRRESCCRARAIRSTGRGLPVGAELHARPADVGTVPISNAALLTVVQDGCGNKQPITPRLSVIRFRRVECQAGSVHSGQHVRAAV